MTSLPHALTSWTLACAMALAPAQIVRAQDTPEVPTETAPAQADMPEIERAWAQGDFVTVRNGLRALAQNNGSALAQYRYGRVLIEGRGGPQDAEAAVLWLGKAVEQNHAAAATLLARIYLSDVPGGPARDPKVAADLLTRAATRGEAEAQYLLGLLYRNGEGVSQDFEVAFNWHLAAAEQQHALAQFALSDLYFNGPEARRDPESGLRWLRAAAGQAVPDAQVRLASLLDDEASGFTNRAEALDWYRRAAELGHPVAQRILGTRYLQGDAVTADAQEAFRWLSRAAEAGEPGAMSNLGYAFASGTGTDQNLQMAARWYGAAAEHGLGRAMIALAGLLEQGAGVPQDLDTALGWYLRALETTDASQARIELGRLAIEGKLEGKLAPQRAVPWVLAAARTGRADALEWLHTQAEAGETRAQSALGRYLLETAPDRQPEALEFLKAAANGGDGPAQFALAENLARGVAGAAPDYVEAHKWFNIAATFGHPDAPERREVLGNLMTPEQTAEAQAAARAWFEADALRTPRPGEN